MSSPDWSTIYVSDTGVNSSRPLTYHPTGLRTLYAYTPDLETGTLTNKRTFFINDQHDPDGLKVDTLGNLWTASGKGVDVIDPFGNLLGKVQTNFTVTNLVFTGEKLQYLWMFVSTLSLPLLTQSNCVSVLGSRRRRESTNS